MGTELLPTRSTSELDSAADFKAQRAHEKHLGGFTWEVVAQDAGYRDAEDARVAVRAYLGRAAMRVSERTRMDSLNKELARLDALQSACWDLAMDGDLKAIETSVRIINMRSKLLGLDEINESKVTLQTVLIRGTKEEYVGSLKEIAQGA